MFRAAQEAIRPVGEEVAYVDEYRQVRLWWLRI